MTEVVVDNGKAFVSEESATIATEAAAQAKQWAEESERQANIATSNADTAVDAKDDAITAKNNAQIWAEGTDAQVQGLGGTHSAQGWAQQESSNYSVTATGSTTPRTLKDRFADVINVKDFGAKGDGVTDDTAAFMDAVATGKTVFIPEGTYSIAETIEGKFIGTTNSKVSKPIDVINIDVIQSRLSNLGFQGSHMMRLPYRQNSGVDDYNWGRAIQGFAYDKYSNILYCTANYAHQGTFVYAFDYESKRLLGTNYDESKQDRGAFYNAYAHSGIGLYRPSQNEPPLLFSSGNLYIAPDTEDINNYNKLHLISWDYNNPNTFSKVRTWELFNLSVYTPILASVCVSENGKKLVAMSQRTSDKKIVFGIWNIEDIINHTANTPLDAIAYKIIENPAEELVSGWQGLALDEDYIYCLSSNASATPHYVTVISIATEKEVYVRPASFEAYELPYDATAYEGESIGFLPVNSKLHLCCAITVNFYVGDVIHAEQHFYDFDAPSVVLQNISMPLQLVKGETGTSDDFIGITKNGLYALPSGSVSDLSGGSWFLHVISSRDETVTRQTIYRGNDVNDIRSRIISSGSASPWKKYVLDTHVGSISLFGDYLGNEFSPNARTNFKLMSNRDTDEKSCAYIGRFRQNSPVDALNGTSFISFDFLENEVRSDEFRIGISASQGEITGGFLYGGNDNYWDLGAGSNRFRTIYAATGAINTSDERQKENIVDVDESLMRAWGKVGFKVFQFKDAVAKKGDEARLHVGVIAQQVIEAFKSENLDAFRYGLLCYDKWEEERDEETGNVIREAGDRYGIRYSEALALECAYQRWKLEQMQKQLDKILNKDYSDNELTL